MKILLLFIMIALSGNSFASAPISGGFTWTFYGNSTYKGYGATYQEACSGLVAAMSGYNTGGGQPIALDGGVYGTTTSSSCISSGKFTSNNAATYYAVGNSSGLVGSSYCPGNPNTAPNTALPLDQQCVPPPPPACVAGAPYEATYSMGTLAQGMKSGLPVRDLNCAIVPTEVVACWKSGAQTYCKYKIQKTGAQYSGAVSSDYTPAAVTQAVSDPRVNLPPVSAGGSNCPTGSVSGGVDSSGIPICIGTGSAPKNAISSSVITSAPSTVTNADTSTTRTQTTITGNKDGSSTTTTTTTHTAVDGTETVSQNSTTSASSDGNPVGQQDRQEDKSDLCKQHPELAICVNSTVSGTCAAVSCTGDAIQCATLRAVAAADCRATDDKAALLASSSYAAGNGILSGSDPQQGSINSLMAGTSVDLSSSSLDQSGFLGGGSCFADKNFTVSGRVVTVSFTTVCNNITPLRYIILACSLMAAYMLVSKSILQG